MIWFSCLFPLVIALQTFSIFFSEELLLEGYPKGFTGAHLHLVLFQLFSQLFLIVNPLSFSWFNSLQSFAFKSKSYGMLTNYIFLHFGYFSLVPGSLKPSYSFLTNIRSFQSCLMFSTTSKASWYLNNSKNWDNLVVLGTCCMPPSCLTTKAKV